jgi:MSHA biogenesis protein MshL
MKPVTASIPTRHPLALATALLCFQLTGCASLTGTAQGTSLMPAVKEALSPAGASAPATGQAALAVAGATSAAAAAPAATAPSASPSLGARDVLAEQPAIKSERRFSLVLANAAPDVLFMALLNDTPLSVAVDPAVKGPLSVTLKDVTLREALELLRELHNLEYKVIGRHILVGPAQLQTRIFTVDYPSFSRQGKSEVRVVSGSMTSGAGGGAVAGGGGSGAGGAGGAGSGGAGGGGPGVATSESSRVVTSQRHDLWSEIEQSLKLLVGDKDGRQVVVSPQTGNVVVRALPREQRLVQEYLDSMHASVQRQVMLEAKIVEVQLRESERSGINWAAFKNGLTTRATAGLVGPGGLLGNTGAINGSLLGGTPGGSLQASNASAGALLGLAFQTNNFAAVLEFLGTQGSTQVLSSPRIATMNNQKAVLKVGTDDFFVTSVSTTTTAVGNNAQTTPTVTVQPFFSGISLDVTPHINADGFITLHVHPAISNVAERNKVLNLGTGLGSLSLPLASSDINETDAVVRARDGNIIAIGGLMRQASSGSDSGIPGAEGSVFRRMLGGQTQSLSEKRELVILLKPTIIDASREDTGRGDALSRLLDWTERQTAQLSR